MAFFVVTILVEVTWPFRKMWDVYLKCLKETYLSLTLLIANLARSAMPAKPRTLTTTIIRIMGKLILCMAGRGDSPVTSRDSGFGLKSSLQKLSSFTKFFPGQMMLGTRSQAYAWWKQGVLDAGIPSGWICNQKMSVAIIQIKLFIIKAYWTGTHRNKLIWVLCAMSLILR